MRAEEVWREGDRARVRMRYVLAGHPIEAEIEAERVGGRWYLADFLRHARAAAKPPAAAGATEAGDNPLPPLPS